MKKSDCRDIKTEIPCSMCNGTGFIRPKFECSDSLQQCFKCRGTGIQKDDDIQSLIIIRRYSDGVQITEYDKLGNTIGDLGRYRSSGYDNKYSLMRRSLLDILNRSG